MTTPLRLLYSSNAFWAASGYGVQGRSLLPRLAELPQFGGRENIAQFAWWGLDGGVHHVDGFTIYPKFDDPYGNDVLGAHCKHFGANVVVSLIDVWVLHQAARKVAPALFCPWLPIDHDPVPQQFLDSLAGAHLPLTYAKWGHKMLTDAGVENVYIPHGIEPTVYKVIDDREEVAKFKRWLTGGLENAHLSVMVAANKGMPDRKWFQGQLECFRDFAADKPDARLYIHSLPNAVHGGIEFEVLITRLGLQGRVIFPNPYLYRLGYPPDYLALVYNAADVLLATTMSEGFGIPIIEAQACGAPVVATNFSAMPELVRWGHLVDVDDMVMTAMHSYQAWPSKRSMVDKLQRLYEAWSLCGGDWPIEQRRKVSALIHAEYDWDTIVRQQWQPLMARLAEEAPPLQSALQSAGVEVPQNDASGFVDAINEELAKEKPARRVAPFQAMPATERSVEIPWLVSKLGTPKEILDIGSADATYVDALVATGAQVTLCDTRKIEKKNAVVWQWIGSAAELPHPDGKFDLVTCVSVLDHVGLDAYGNAADDTLLARVVAELARVTAPNGRLLLTVPFGRDHVTTHPGGGQRVFGLAALLELFGADKWQMASDTYWQLQGNEYKAVPLAAVENSEYGEWRALACIGLELERVAEVEQPQAIYTNGDGAGEAVPQ